MKGHHLHNHFDALRGISAFVVFLAHVNQTLFFRFFGSQALIALISEFVARMAVLIFFLLSGYLITQSIRLNITRNGHFSPTDYLLSRIARIYPPYIGVILLCLIVLGMLAWFDLPGYHTAYGIPSDHYRAVAYYSLRWWEIPLGLLMILGLLGADGPLWTLYVEFQMYIVAMGVAVWFGKGVSRFFWLLPAIAASLLATIYPTLVVVWILGALANLVPIERKVVIALAATSFALLLALLAFLPQWFGSVDTADGHKVQLVASVFLCSTLILSRPKWHFPEWVVGSGDFSYSLYVVHWPLLMLVLSLMQNWMGASYWRTVIIAVACILAVTAFAVGFAKALERQSFFRGCLVRFFGRLGRQAAS